MTSPDFRVCPGLYLFFCAIADRGVLLCLDYRETAAKFQKEWQIQAPHRHFDFAPHVKNYALVSTLNKGLVYEDLERQFAESRQVRIAISLCGMSDWWTQTMFGCVGWLKAVCVAPGVLTTPRSRRFEMCR